MIIMSMLNITAFKHRKQLLIFRFSLALQVITRSGLGERFTDEHSSDMCTSGFLSVRAHTSRHTADSFSH